MKRVLMAVAAMVVVFAVSFASTAAAFAKLPKCSGRLCRDVGCSADVLCSSGTSVKTCADVCGGR